MKENKGYKRNLKEYLHYKELAEKDKANGLEKSENIAKFNTYKEILNDIRLSYSLSEYQFHAFIKKQQRMYKKHIDSNTAQKLATAVWKAASEVMFRNGKDIHFKKFGTLTSLEGKKNTQGIRFLKDIGRMSAVTLSNCTETLCYVNSQVKRLIELFHLTIFRNIK